MGRPGGSSVTLWLKRVIPVGLVILFLIQLIRPSTVNPAIDTKLEIAANLTVDPAVQSIFNRSCNDCHSNRTVWPWYSHMASCFLVPCLTCNAWTATYEFLSMGHLPGQKNPQAAGRNLQGSSERRYAPDDVHAHAFRSQANGCGSARYLHLDDDDWKKSHRNGSNENAMSMQKLICPIIDIILVTGKEDYPYWRYSLIPLPAIDKQCK